jgi:hypothetical protein
LVVLLTLLAGAGAGPGSADPLAPGPGAEPTAPEPPLVRLEPGWGTLQQTLGLPAWVDLDLEILAEPMANPVGGLVKEANWIQQTTLALTLRAPVGEAAAGEWKRWAMHLAVAAYNGGHSVEEVKALLDDHREERKILRLSDTMRRVGVARLTHGKHDHDWAGLADATQALIDDALAFLPDDDRPIDYIISGSAPHPTFAHVGYALSSWRGRRQLGEGDVGRGRLGRGGRGECEGGLGGGGGLRRVLW